VLINALEGLAEAEKGYFDGTVKDAPAELPGQEADSESPLAGLWRGLLSVPGLCLPEPGPLSWLRRFATPRRLAPPGAR
jgi:hypothetical protein